MSDNFLKHNETGFDGGDFLAAVVDYLLKERRYVDEDIRAHDELSVENKELSGILIRSAIRLDDGRSCSVRYRTPVNFTKLRPGDEVRICETGADTGGRVAVVEENAISEMSFSVVPSKKGCTVFPENADIVVREENNLDTLISVVGDIREGSRGVHFMKILGGLSAPRKEARFGKITDFLDGEVPASFNDGQRRAVDMAMRRPSVAYVQGTPGSGKTHLLSVIAKGYARRSKDVVVMALTHQAVNNALNKIRKLDADIPVVKVGKLFKNLDLDEGVARSETFSDYLTERNIGGDFYGDVGHVVGMTFQSALYNLGKRRSSFIPQIILFDEAGQVPLAHAVAIGAFGCGSVVFIGDDVQMPPIYHEKLLADSLSESVFERIKRLYPRNGVILDVTYRMNGTIAGFVGDNFYLPRDIKLTCSPMSENRKIDDPVIEFRTCRSAGSRDENEVEAIAAVETVDRYLGKGIAASRIAVITPYRRQVRLVHKILTESHPGVDELPLVDTVERLQGQDVDVIVITFAVDDELFFAIQKSFLLNPNRLNVMFSRATSKVVVISSLLVKKGILGMSSASAQIP